MKNVASLVKWLQNYLPGQDCALFWKEELACKIWPLFETMSPKQKLKALIMLDKAVSEWCRIAPKQGLFPVQVNDRARPHTATYLHDISREEAHNYIVHCRDWEYTGIYLSKTPNGGLLIAKRMLCNKLAMGKIQQTNLVISKALEFEQIQKKNLPLFREVPVLLESNM